MIGIVPYLIPLRSLNQILWWDRFGRMKRSIPQKRCILLILIKVVVLRHTKWKSISPSILIRMIILPAPLPLLLPLPLPLLLVVVVVTTQRRLPLKLVLRYYTGDFITSWKWYNKILNRHYRSGSPIRRGIHISINKYRIRPVWGCIMGMGYGNYYWSRHFYPNIGGIII